MRTGAVREVEVRRVEVRYLLPDAERLCLALRARDAALEPPIRQEDQLYAPGAWPPGATAAETPLARVRTVDGRHFLSVERPAPVRVPAPDGCGCPDPIAARSPGKPGGPGLPGRPGLPGGPGAPVRNGEDSALTVDTEPPLVLDPSPRVEHPGGPGPLPERHQTEVSDREATHQALLALGFRPTTRLTSTHRRTRLGDVVVSVDEVDGHGTFLTLHRDCPDDVPVEVLHAGLADVAASLGIHGSRVDGGFGRLVRPQLSPE